MNVQLLLKVELYLLCSRIMPADIAFAHVENKSSSNDRKKVKLEVRK